MNNVSEGHKNKQSYANTRTTGKEQYYTNSEVVDLCIAEVQRHIDLSDKTILEPAGGTGEFIEGFKRIGIEDKSIISYDIEPHHPLVKEGNYLETDLSSFDNLISITNPPFGRASSLAKKFFNHATGHSPAPCPPGPCRWQRLGLAGLGKPGRIESRSGRRPGLHSVRNPFPSVSTLPAWRHNGPGQRQRRGASL